MRFILQFFHVAVAAVATLLLVCGVISRASATLTRRFPQAHCTNDLLLRRQNALVRENCLPGNWSSDWDVNGVGDPTIQGFATDISFNRGARAEFKIDTISSHYRVDIFRLGYYQGLGARHVATVHPRVSLPQKQPPCLRESSTLLYDCGNWAVSAFWEIPADAVSGVYVARLVRMDVQPGETVTWRTDNSQAQDDPRFAMPGGESMKRPRPQPHAYGANGMGRLRNALKEPRASHIFFVVRCDECRADIVFQTADTVWQAYNSEGGASTYGSMDPANPGPRCLKASYNRPLRTRLTRSVNMYLGAEFPISRFLESQGYDVTYVAGVDVDRFGRKLLPLRKIFLSAGHDEYWSGPQRKNVEWARDVLGMHLVFLSGNEMYWRVRWEDNYRTMVVYKESQSLVKLDPNASEWTGTFRDSRSINPLGANPENAVTGSIFTLNAWRNDPLVVPFEYSRLRQWRKTAIAQLQPGQHAILHRGILGHEIDEDVDNGFRPAGLIRLSETHIDNVMYIQDHGSAFDSGSGVHHLVMYRATASGALVFGAGTVQWGWALDGFHDSEHQIPAHLVNHMNIRVGTDILAPCRAIQQFTINFLADMGAQPATISKHLQRVTEITDRAAPECRILAVVPVHPLNREHAGSGAGSRFAVVVKASDGRTGGGVVAAVEVQVEGVDGFDHQWHPTVRAKITDSNSKDTNGGEAANETRLLQHSALLDVLRHLEDSNGNFPPLVPFAGRARAMIPAFAPGIGAHAPLDESIPSAPATDFESLDLFVFVGAFHARSAPLGSQEHFAARCRGVDDSLNLAQPSILFRAVVPDSAYPSFTQTASASRSQSFNADEDL